MTTKERDWKGPRKGGEEGGGGGGGRRGFHSFYTCHLGGRKYREGVREEKEKEKKGRGASVIPRVLRVEGKE